MIAVDALLLELRTRGLTVNVVDGQLRVGPARLLTPDLVERIKGLRDELLAQLLRVDHAAFVRQALDVFPDSSIVERSAWARLVSDARERHPHDPQARLELIAQRLTVLVTDGTPEQQALARYLWACFDAAADAWARQGVA